MTIWRPWFRFRRIHSEQFEQGCLRRVRHHFALELGMRDDVRSEIASLKKELVGLRLALAVQTAVDAMANAAQSAPSSLARPTPRRTATPITHASEPNAVPPRPTTGTGDVIVLIADKNWP